MNPSSVYKEEFATVIEKNKGLIYKVANAYCKDPEDRKDLVQEIIIQLLHSFEKYDTQYKLSTWMYRIALNVAISFFRKERTRRQTVLPINGNIIEIAEENFSQEKEEGLSLLQQFINELKELDKALMILYLEENSYKEIAEILGITETNVASKISRIKEKLKQKFNSINN